MEIKLNKDNFDEQVIKASLPVLVDFWATWCGPCKIMGPILEEVAKEYEGKVNVGKVNVDENPELFSNYGIMSVPTIKIFKNGQSVGEVIGSVSKQSLIATLEASIK